MKRYFYHSAHSKGVFSNYSKSLRLSFPLIILLFLGLCNCTHKIATEKLPTTQILFGKGGGFTGRTHDFALLEDGRILEMHADSATQKIVKKINKGQAASFYASIDSMPSQTWLYNVPGNIYHYITVKKEGAKDKKIVWDGGRDAKNVPTYIVDYYKKLMAEVPRKKHDSEHN
jgi:hypothetical protein